MPDGESMSAGARRATGIGQGTYARRTAWQDSMSRPDPSIAACRWLPFRGAVDPRGCINFVENATDLDFAFQRAFWIHGVPAGQNRGHHAHRDARLVIVALSGAADMVIDDGRCRETVRLDQPDLGMLVGTWV